MSGQRVPEPDWYWVDKYKNLQWDQINVRQSDNVRQHPLPQEDIDYLRERHNITFDHFLGAGDYGSVWLARVGDAALACKIIPLVNAAKPDEPPETVMDAAKRIMNECEIMKELDHPSIVSGKHVYYVEESAGVTQFPLVHALIFMELFDQSLKDLLSCGALTETASMLWFRQIADALHYLHVDKSIVHQDIHWGNIMIKYRSENSDIIIVKLADFGLALRRSDCGETWKAFENYGKSTQCTIDYYNNALNTDIQHLAKSLSLSLVGWKQPSFDDAIDAIASDSDVSKIARKYKIHSDVVQLIANMYSNNYNISDVCKWIYERDVRKNK